YRPEARGHSGARTCIRSTEGCQRRYRLRPQGLLPSDCPKLGTSRGRTRTLLKSVSCPSARGGCPNFRTDTDKMGCCPCPFSWRHLNERPLVLPRGRHEPVGLERVRRPLRCLPYGFCAPLLALDQPERGIDVASRELVASA